jgi:hypothetical protein
MQTPLTTEQIFKIIEEQARLTGWKVPPTVQVARAIERAHGIGVEAEPAPEPDLEWCPMCGGPADNGHDRCYPPNAYACSKCLRA